MNRARGAGKVDREPAPRRGDRPGAAPAVLALGLLSLVLGLLVLDRGFASWRNDPSTLRDSAGAYPAQPNALTAEQAAQKAATRRGMMLSGAGMILVSVGLFTRRPV